jgi:3-dehydroquinate synthase
MSGNILFLYGAPGSGKSTIGKILAQSLDMPFFDLDMQIEQAYGAPVWKIFSVEGEAGFRKRETETLRRLVEAKPGIVALGGGSLLNPVNRTLSENNGHIVVLHAPLPVIQTRLESNENQRPLLAGDLKSKLENLLTGRAEHYLSFQFHMDTALYKAEEAAWQIQIQQGLFRVKGMNTGKAGSTGAYDVRVRRGGLADIGQELASRNINGRIVLVSDDTVGPLYAQKVLDSLQQSGFTTHSFFIKSGEEFKTIQTVNNLWEFFLENQLDRGSTVLALGGGVVSDLAGFAAATYLRGIRWIGLPTTLLAMADASLGGKTGADLPQGKNLIGAFHAPALVLADPNVLTTLPDRELCSGFAEIVKHGIISDPIIFEECKIFSSLTIDEIRRESLEGIVRRAMAVKIHVIEQDPYEQNIRAILNAGHTIGHAVELASGFQISHGEAVSIGLVVEARMAEELGIARSGLADEILAVLSSFGLPVSIPTGFNQETIETAIFRDKKRDGGAVKFAVPVEIGQARYGIKLGLEEIRRNHAFSAGFTRS